KWAPGGHASVTSELDVIAFERFASNARRLRSGWAAEPSRTSFFCPGQSCSRERLTTFYATRTSNIGHLARAMVASGRSKARWPVNYELARARTGRDRGLSTLPPVDSRHFVRSHWPAKTATVHLSLFARHPNSRPASALERRFEKSLG